MRRQLLPLFCILLYISLLGDSSALFADDAVASGQTAIRFNQDIRPILSDRCFLCHGPDRSSEQAQESGLRLDDRELAVDYGVFDFDDVSESEILARITSDDPDLQMPPPHSFKESLSEAETTLIRRWIEQNAPYEKHWAYLTAQRPEVPAVDDSKQLGHPIDAFVNRQLKSNGMNAAATADRETLIRRVSFDLTGLPPTISEIDSFLKDSRPLDQAFEQVVDRLLESNRYGEHMARFWLDAARYADTSGYQYDREREQWVWRDWVINAFNTNKPFDDFTIEQIAGDLLPDATEQDHLATGFNRNHPITIEGGVVDEEYRTEYVIDRVVTTSTVWLGQTFLCARCHDHKYDPISQKDFYQFYSFFNNVPERGLNGFDPKRKVPSPLRAEKTEGLRKAVQQCQSVLAKKEIPIEQWEQRYRERSPVWSVRQPSGVVSSGGATPESLDDGSILMTQKNPVKDDYEFMIPVGDESAAAIQLEALMHPTLTNGSASRGSNGNFVLTEFLVEAALPGTPEQFDPIKIASAVADYEQPGFTIDLAIDGESNTQKGWAVNGNEKVENRTAVFNFDASVPAGSMLRIKMQHRYGLSHQIGRFRLSVSPHAVAQLQLNQLMAIAPEARTPQQSEDVRRVLIREFGDEELNRLVDRLDQAQQAVAVSVSFPETMVMKEMPSPREVFVLDRGEYDKPRKDEPLTAAVPESLGSLPEGFPNNRLGLARWLVSREQPLTARVIVNRFWAQLFGIGLVKTSEDFGSQGEFPTHPDLLDWLAVEFMESGWDVKQIFKTIVMSDTYRQSSVVTVQTYAADPDNRRLSRGPRIRLDGEAIRDSALGVSGLLLPTIGGPSVYPYHPDGLWLEINNRPGYSRTYPHQQDTSQHHRRSMYSFWKRTVTPPSIAMFDAPSREYCVVRRSRTNTPLQAFVMLHDPQFIEAARHLASRMLSESGTSVKDQIEYGFRLCTSRKPTAEEMSILQSTFNDKFAQYTTDPEAVEKLLSVGATSVSVSDNERDELAAMTQVARMLLNLSEFLTKS